MLSTFELAKECGNALSLSSARQRSLCITQDMKCGVTCVREPLWRNSMIRCALNEAAESLVYVNHAQCDNMAASRGNVYYLHRYDVLSD